MQGYVQSAFILHYAGLFFLYCTASNNPSTYESGRSLHQLTPNIVFSF